MKRAKSAARLILLAMSMLAVTPVFAQSEGAVIAAINTMRTAVVAAISTSTSTLSTVMTNVGAAITGSGNVAAAVAEGQTNAQNSMAIRQAMDNSIARAASNYEVPDSVCSNSASGGMYQIASAAVAGGGSFRAGGVAANNSDVSQVVNSPNVDPSADSRRDMTVHKYYCDGNDYAAYGGSVYCEAVSQMPGGDKRMDSLVSGAGVDGKAPDYTWSPDQVDAARMYLQNTTRHSIGRDLGKGEISTPGGAQYQGELTQYEALVDAASYPQRESIADHEPNTATKTLLTDDLQSTSANTYYQAVASKYAQENGVMSFSELEKFEAGRRYANTAYETDLGDMSGDNLVRELIRVQAFNSWLLLEMKEEIHHQAIINGMQLSLQAQSIYGPVLQRDLRKVDGYMGAQ